MFPKAVIDEAIERLKVYKETADANINAVRSFSWEDASDEQAMLDFITTALHHYADSLSQTSVSLPLLDSLFTEALAREDYNAELVCQVVDSLGNVLQREADGAVSSQKLAIDRKSYLRCESKK